MTPSHLTDEEVFSRYFVASLRALAPIYQNNPALVDTAADYARRMLALHRQEFSIPMRPRGFGQ